ncbi:hypothetical protein HYT05_03880 [Candidatus Kaiserbacteria bacterium]|nr:hypothetical protein [Candidatus Kaiserbacteria bacterium]
MSALGFPLSLHPLDPSFVGPKPIEEAPDSVFHQLEADGDLIIERKRNGHASYITATGQGRQEIGIYSRGIHVLTDKFPALVDELRSLNIPSDTLLAGELLVEVDGVDDLGAFGSIAQSKPARAIELQSKRSVILALYNVFVMKGRGVIQLPYQDRLDMVREIVAKRATNAVRVVEVLDSPFDTARVRVKQEKWEGLVLYDKRAGSAYRLNDRPDLPLRPHGCWKWKPYHEGDFVATGWVPSTSNRFKGLVRDLLISQYDPVSRKLVSWGKVGVGLSAAQRKEYADDTLYPMVFEVQFERRTPNNRLISAHILRRRTDKAAGECFSPIE